MATIFNSDFDTSRPQGEFFWHATTIANIFKMIQYNAGGLQPIGTGQLGAGFYVTGTRSDYQKGMARRSREEEALDVPLFLLYVHVQEFYGLKPHFLDGWSNVATSADFSAVCWYEHGPGSVDEPERGGFMPSAKDGKRVMFKYGQYREELIADRNLVKKTQSEKLQFLDMLWHYASKNERPSYEKIKPFGPAAAMVPMVGARTILKRSVMELAFRTKDCLAGAAIVGAKLFSPSASPLALKFDYKKKKYDFSGTVVDESSLHKDEDPMNFHDEAWVDLDAMIKILSS